MDVTIAASISVAALKVHMPSGFVNVNIIGVNERRQTKDCPSSELSGQVVEMESHENLPQEMTVVIYHLSDAT
jgi:hypothetical protein